MFAATESSKQRLMRFILSKSRGINHTMNKKKNTNRFYAVVWTHSIDLHNKK